MSRHNPSANNRSLKHRGRDDSRGLEKLMVDLSAQSVPDLDAIESQYRRACADYERRPWAYGNIPPEMPEHMRARMSAPSTKPNTLSSRERKARNKSTKKRKR